MSNTLTQERTSIRGVVSFPIYYEDTDLSGFVYHANYLKFFERGREHVIGIEYLADLHRNQQALHFVVSQATLKFVAPLRHGDKVEVDTVGYYGKSPAVPFIQKAFRIDPQGERILVCEGDITIVALNQENRPVRLPDKVIEYFGTRSYIV